MTSLLLKLIASFYASDFDAVRGTKVLKGETKSRYFESNFYNQLSFNSRKWTNFRHSTLRQDKNRTTGVFRLSDGRWQQVSNGGRQERLEVATATFNKDIKDINTFIHDHIRHLRHGGSRLSENDLTLAFSPFLTSGTRWTSATLHELQDRFSPSRCDYLYNNNY